MREPLAFCFASFEAFDFKFHKRECNKVAHGLATFIFRVGMLCPCWKEQALNFVYDLVVDELAVRGEVTKSISS